MVTPCTGRNVVLFVGVIDADGSYIDMLQNDGTNHQLYISRNTVRVFVFPTYCLYLLSNT